MFTNFTTSLKSFQIGGSNNRQEITLKSSSDEDSYLTINGNTLSGKNIQIKNGKIIVDNKEVDLEKYKEEKGEKFNVVINGNFQGQIDCTELNINGDITGDVDCTSLTCNNIRGNVDATSIVCQEIKGDVEAVSVMGH